MARGGFSNHLAGIEPEIEAALVEAAPSPADIEVKRAQAEAKRSEAERIFSARIREQMEVNITENEVDPSLVDMSDQAMAYRVQNMRTLAAKGYKINLIERRVMYSGKSLLFLLDGETEETIALERSDGQLQEMSDVALDALSAL